MRDTTRAALVEINRRFYERNADEFARTRSGPWPGWRRVLDRWIERRSGAPEPRVLDLGCGNGRFWPSLWSRVQGIQALVGLDLNLQLLRRAHGVGESRRGTTICARADCFGELGLPVRSGAYDLVVLFGVIHHIPSFDQRSRVLQRAFDALRPGGSLAVTFWRAAVLSRKRALDWQDYLDRSGITLDRSDLEPGDSLLGWGAESTDGGPGAARYCHLFDDPEVQTYAAALRGVDWHETFDADGPGGEDNRYLIVEKRA